MRSSSAQGAMGLVTRHTPDEQLPVSLLPLLLTRHLLVTDWIACQAQKDCQYDEAGYELVS
jgi:hypothetical protein